MRKAIRNKKWKKIIQKSGLFDSKYYLFSYADVRSNDIDPIQHYIKYGADEGRNPSSEFDTRFYLEAYPDVKQSGINPLVHYILYGKEENRFVNAEQCGTSYQVINEDTNPNIPKIVFDKTKDEFVEYVEHERFETKIKLVAFYLPQFHPFPENDEWWGKGFTEWTNVTKANKNYEGHYQPHLPIHNGFYDLRVPEVMVEQAKMAKNYGIYGFNFYYYWFDSKVLMHKPFEILLKHKEIDINFCITWANENWTRRWDGAEHDVLIAQNHCEEDSIKFIESLYKFFNDERYIRINNKPVLIIYRVDIIPKMKETVDLWRKKVKEAGFDGIYLVCAQTFGIKSPKPYGFDAAMEFPPHTAQSKEITKDIDFLNKEFIGQVYDYNQVVNNAIKSKEPKYKLFRTAMLSWDNTARKQNSSHTFENFSLLKYKQWLSNMVANVYNNKKYDDNEKFVFVNAWNEWAEGTHLEPDRKYGYGYLEATHDVISNYQSKNDFFLNSGVNKSHEIAVIVHIHYADVWADINRYLSNLKSFGFDLFITITNINEGVISNVKKYYPDANIRIVENRGRDILPFIDTYKDIMRNNYKYVCKVHSKKSIYREDGHNIREQLYKTLLGSKEHLANIFSIFDNNRKVGLIACDELLIEHTDHNMTYDTQIVRDVADLLGFEFEYSKFPAGSMFWFRPDALQGIEKIESKYFDVEEGLADGTVAHGVERLFGSLVIFNGYDFLGIKYNEEPICLHAADSSR